MEKLVSKLRANSMTIGSVESLTGGLFASELVAVSKASSVYLGSFVTYANSIKETILDIDSADIEKYGVVSSEIVKLMAKQANKQINSDIMVAFSGNAGPDTLENKPVGAVYTCIKIYNDYYINYDVLEGSRNEIRLNIVNLTKDRIIKLLGKGD